MLPFWGKQWQNEPQLFDKFLEFEQGMLPDHQQSEENWCIDLTYIPTTQGKSAEEITKLLGKPEMKTMDLIIGPDQTEAQFKPLSDFVIKHDIKWWCHSRRERKR